MVMRPVFSTNGNPPRETPSSSQATNRSLSESRGRRIATGDPSLTFKQSRSHNAFLNCFSHSHKQPVQQKRSAKYDVVLFDAAETLFTTRGTIGEIYSEVARKYGSTALPTEIQAAFLRQFQHSGPLTTDNEKQWWSEIVFRVFDDVGIVS